MPKADVFETLLYGYVMWSPNEPDDDRLRQVHHSMLFRCLGGRKRKREYHTFSYDNAHAKTNSEGIETTVRKRRTLLARFVARIGEKPLPRRVMF